MKLFSLLFENKLPIQKFATELERMSKAFGGKGNEKFFFDKMVLFLKLNKIKKLKEGNDRVVYDLGDYVLKLEHEFDNKQNFNEISSWECAKDNNTTSCLAKIEDYGSDFSWIIMEKAEKLLNNENEVIKFINMNLQLPKSLFLNELLQFKFLVDSILGRRKVSDKKLENQIKFIELNKTKWFNDFIENVRNCNFVGKDLHEGNWGIMKDGRFVLIDYGF